MEHISTYEELSAKPDSEAYHHFMRGPARWRDKQEEYHDFLAWKREAKWSRDPRHIARQRILDDEKRDILIFKAFNSKLDRQC